ncbi:hypothetical protein NC651_019790 [Populus alba x Populus x berolinensis]|nr:hypothetical protein NC651_019790 [Populus alba x Populus x berolinensis]
MWAAMRLLKHVLGIIDTTYLHIGMILSTLSLSAYGFAIRLYPKDLIPMEIIVHPYIPMILPTSSQCGTLVVYPTILPSNKGPPSLPSNDHSSVHSLPTRILHSLFHRVGVRTRP